MNWEYFTSWQPWLAPAIILSIAAFFSHFFGKVITDQKAFSDDREWDIEFFGIWFLSDFFLPPAIIAAALLIYFGDVIKAQLNIITTVITPLTYDWVNLGVVLLISLYCAGAASIIGRERYGLSQMMPNISDQTNKKRFMAAININAAFLQPFVMLLVLIFGVEVTSGSMPWIMAFSVETFSAILLIALNYSLMRSSFPKVNVFCSSRKTPFKDVVLLKLNKDIVKLRDKGKTFLVERRDLLRVEIVDAAQEKRYERSIVPFATWIPFLLSVFLLWNHDVLLAFLVGIIFPIVLFSVGAWLIGLPTAASDGVQGSLIDEIKKIFNVPVIVASVIAFLAFIVIIMAAWEHYERLLFLGGILPTFISWALLQVSYSRQV